MKLVLILVGRVFFTKTRDNRFNENLYCQPSPVLSRTECEITLHLLLVQKV